MPFRRPIRWFPLLSDKWQHVPAKWRKPINKITIYYKFHEFIQETGSEWKWNYDSMVKYHKSASLILILMFVDKNLQKLAAQSGARLRKR